MLNDLRFSLRSLRRSPGFAIVAILTLGLGIGVSTAMFSVLHAVVLKPLPYHQADRIVAVSETFPYPGGRGLGSICVPRFTAWKEQNRSLEAIAIFERRAITLREGAGAERISGFAVTADFFRVLGANAALGRTFQEGADRPGRDQVVVISDRLWQRRFKGAPAILDRKVKLDTGEYTIIGVMPPSFRYPVASSAEMFVPLAIQPVHSQGHSIHSWQGLARLKPGVTLTQAQADMSALSASFEQNVEEQSRRGAALRTQIDQLVGWASPTLWMLFGAVLLVLLIACVNVANLLLTRAAGRRVEVAIRSAVGASRARIVRQLLVESTVLATAGAVAGVSLSSWILELVKLVPYSVPRLAEAGLDGSVLVFTAGATVVCAALFGLAPAWQASRTRLSGFLKDSARSGGGRTNRMRDALVVAEVSITLTLLLAAGLLTRSLMRLQNPDLGFAPENLLTMKLPVSKQTSKNPTATIQFYERTEAAMSAAPGVRAAGLISLLPPNEWGSNGNFAIKGRPSVSDAKAPFAEMRFVNPTYFSTMGIPLRKGRFFTAADRDGAACVRIINEQLARQYWPDSDPIGAEIGSPGRLCQVVGVVGNVKNRGVQQPVTAELYMPLYQIEPGWTPDEMSVVLRTEAAPGSIAPSVRAALTKVDSEARFQRVRPMTESIADAYSQPRFRTLLIGAFAVLALLLAVIGLYGVISYEVAQRTHEIGVRMALGAQAAQVRGMVVRHGVRLAIAGVALGSLGALSLTRFIRGYLFEISPTDPVSYIGIGALVIVVAVMASYMPARRASRIEPISALRHE